MDNLFDLAKDTINSCNRFNDIEIEEALSAWNIAMKEFGNKPLDMIPDRINICTCAGNIVVSIINNKGLPNSYNVIPNKSLSSTFREHYFISGLLISSIILIPLLIFKYTN